MAIEAQAHRATIPPIFRVHMITGHEDHLFDCAKPQNNLANHINFLDEARQEK